MSYPMFCQHTRWQWRLKTASQQVDKSWYFVRGRQCKTCGCEIA